jgi:hypothetical protein
MNINLYPKELRIFQGESWTCKREAGKELEVFLLIHSTRKTLSKVIFCVAFHLSEGGIKVKSLKFDFDVFFDRGWTAAFFSAFFNKRQNRKRRFLNSPFAKGTNCLCFPIVERIQSIKIDFPTPATITLFAALHGT